MDRGIFCPNIIINYISNVLGNILEPFYKNWKNNASSQCVCLYDLFFKIYIRSRTDFQKITLQCAFSIHKIWIEEKHINGVLNFRFQLRKSGNCHWNSQKNISKGSLILLELVQSRSNIILQLHFYIESCLQPILP